MTKARTLADNFAADINGITAGTGITGGGTSGTVTITNDMATTIAAKGDLVAGTANDAYAALTVGANNTVLTADSSTATGLKWATPVSGKVLQVVYSDTSTTATNNTDTAADTGLSGTITPTSATSKVLILVSHNGITKTTGNAGNGATFTFLRGATNINIAGVQNWSVRNGHTNTTLVNTVATSFGYLDSPATTSATTYKTQFFNNFNGAGVSVQAGNSASTMILMEIGA